MEIIALFIIAFGCFHLAIRCFSTKKSYDKMVEEEEISHDYPDCFEETEYSLEDLS